MAAVVEFGSEHTFTDSDGDKIKTGSLVKGQVVKILSQNGEYKVVGKTFERGKLIIKVEKMPTYLFKVFHMNLQEEFGVEAVCGQDMSNQPTEYHVTYRGKKRWVQMVDCQVIG